MIDGGVIEVLVRLKPVSDESSMVSNIKDAAVLCNMIRVENYHPPCEGINSTGERFQDRFKSAFVFEGAMQMREQFAQNRLGRGVLVLGHRRGRGAARCLRSVKDFCYKPGLECLGCLKIERVIGRPGRHSFGRLAGPFNEDGLQAGLYLFNPIRIDRKSTRLNSSHANISYAV